MGRAFCGSNHALKTMTTIELIDFHLNERAQIPATSREDVIDILLDIRLTLMTELVPA